MNMIALKVRRARGVEDHDEDMKTTLDKGGSKFVELNAYIDLPNLPIRAISGICSLRCQYIPKSNQTSWMQYNRVSPPIVLAMLIPRTPKTLCSFPYPPESSPRRRPR